jgi:hypothetical protein
LEEKSWKGRLLPRKKSEPQVKMKIISQNRSLQEPWRTSKINVNQRLKLRGYRQWQRGKTTIPSQMVIAKAH